MQVGRANKHSVTSVGEDSPNFTNFNTFQTLIEATDTPVNLATLVIPDGCLLVIKAKSDNEDKISVGTSFEDLNFNLDPGESVSLKISNVNLVWINGTEGEGIEGIVES